MGSMLLVVMGVSGSGKTTVGRLVAARLGLPFMEGDALHPARNIAKMAHGEPLDDADRRPWLDRIAAELRRAKEEGQGLVLTCSALKRSYRDRLRKAVSELQYLWLEGEFELIKARLEARKGHFMPPELLRSQFAALEDPGPEERVIAVSIDRSPDAIAEEIVARLSRSHSPDPRG